MLTMVERVLILKSADLLREVGPRHLLKLAEVAREVEVWKGDTIYEEDDPSDALYMVVEGRVRLSLRGQPASEVGPGEAFGTWALVDDSDRGHRVECIEDGLVLALHRDEFYDVAAGDLVLLQQVLRALAKRLRALVADRPEEARIEGEGFEKTEAMEAAEAAETEEGADTAAAAPSPAAAAQPLVTAPDAGASLAAAALGQPSTEVGQAPPVPEPAGVTEEIATPEPIEPVEPQQS